MSPRLMFMSSRFAVCIGTQLEFPVCLIDTRTYLHPIYLIYCTALDLSSPSPPTRTSTTHPRHTSAPHLRRHLLLPRFVWASPTHARFFVCRLLKSCRPSCPSVVEQSCDFFFFETMIPKPYQRTTRYRHPTAFPRPRQRRRGHPTAGHWYPRLANCPPSPCPTSQNGTAAPPPLLPSRRSCCALLFQIRIPTGHGTLSLLDLGSRPDLDFSFGCLSPFVDLSSGSSLVICASRKLESRSSRRSSVLALEQTRSTPSVEVRVTPFVHPSSGVLFSSLASFSPPCFCLRPTSPPTPTPPHFTAT